jgi:menaquinone-9 beta-reductase
MLADLVVVGAGPAGIATAIAARLKGLRVSVLDFRKPPIDKPCGEGLLPEAAAALRRLGVGIDASSAFPFEAIRFCDAESSAVSPVARGQAYGLRRTALHQLLVERAAELRVRFLWGARVSEFRSDHLHAVGERIAFRWLVGADGQNSIVRKWAGLNPRRLFHSRFGFRRHYDVAPWSRCVEVHWGERCQMFVTPTGAGEVCVALLSSDPQMRIERALAQFPEVAGRLRGARAITQEAGAVSVLGRARAVARGSVALVGDASCPIDGIAGQGLSLAFQQAVVLGEALAREDLRYYEAAHKQITGMAIRMTRLLLLMNSSAWLRRKTLRLFANNPHVFARMISLHTREDEASDLKARDVAGLGWRVLGA